VLYGVSACFGLLSLFLIHPAGFQVSMVLIVTGGGVFIGIRQLHYHELLELGHMASRTLSQRQVMANDINIRRAPEALSTCTSVQKFCQILEQCLKPAGFDGFGIYLDADSPEDLEVQPLTKIGASKLRFVWCRVLSLSATNWSLSFSLKKRNGERLGDFALYRKNTASPLLIDLEILTASAFADAVAGVVERMEYAWFARARKGKTAASPSFGVALPHPVLGPRMAAAMELHSSG
jgi:hypothetical protein